VKVSAIVPALNEAATIKHVVHTLLACAVVDEVIVVDDGSTDGTAAQLPLGVRCLRNERPQGKGQAMQRAVTEARGDVLCFFDADIIGLTTVMVTSIVLPVLTGEADMVVGLRWLPRYRVRFLRAMLAKLSGERALTRELWNSVPAGLRCGYKIEAALNVTARRTGMRVRNQLMPGLKQIIKERKRGLLPGLLARFCMAVEVASAYIRLLRRAGCDRP
jgi:glycosyltransferase involved in cell wall biosynthesis